MKLSPCPEHRQISAQRNNCALISLIAFLGYAATIDTELTIEHPIAFWTKTATRMIMMVIYVLTGQQAFKLHIRYQYRRKRCVICNPAN